jgi:hypothetical protein
MEPPKRGGLKLKAKGKLPRGVNSENVIASKRRKQVHQAKVKLGVVDKDRFKAVTAKLKVGDRVQIRTAKFGKDYAADKHEFTNGTIKSMKKNKASVKWDGSSGLWKSHLVHLKKLMPALPSIIVRKDRVWELPECIPPKPSGDLGIYGDISLDDIFENRDLFPEAWAAECVLPILDVGAKISNAEHDYGGSYPKDFYEALVRPDWRQWTRQEKTRQDKKRHTKKDKTRQDKIRQDKIRQDKSRQDKIRQYKTRQDKIRQDKTRQDKVRGKTGQDKATQNKTRQERTRQERTRQERTRQERTRQERTAHGMARHAMTRQDNK